MYNTIAIEDSGIPSAVLINHGFAQDVRSAASGKGMPGIRDVSHSVPTDCSVHAEIESGIDAIMDEVVSALTRPLTEEEAAPRPKQVEKVERTAFGGDLKEVNQYYYKRGWTDGLPIIPPTDEAVREMLTGTDLPPSHVVSKIIPRMGKATVEKIAVNAVMAGALPTVMPVLIATVQAVMEPRAAFGTWEVSTGSWAPCLILNGPVRKQLQVRCTTGALSPGNIANATIGRALGLIVKNIGGARTAIEDMGALGNPLKYTAVLGEDEEESPWEPLHVARGLKREDSAVTVFFPNSYNQVQAYATDARGLLNTMVYNVNPQNSQEALACFLVLPQHAQIMAREGYGRKDFKAFIAENATAPYYRHGQWGRPPEARRLAWNTPSNPQDPIRLMPNTECFDVVVAGGPGAFMGLLRASGHFKRNGFVTKKIEFPLNWDKLVEKYKGMVPAHVRY